MLDACLMEAAQLKINLFEEFCKYLVDREHADKTKLTETVKLILDCLGNSTPLKLGSQILDKQKRIHNQTALIDCEPGVMPPFIMQQDPTVLFVGSPLSVMNSHQASLYLSVWMARRTQMILAKTQNSRTGFR